MLPTCTKCQGLMVHEYVGDIQSYVTKCYNCGRIVFPSMKVATPTWTEERKSFDDNQKEYITDMRRARRLKPRLMVPCRQSMSTSTATH